MLVREVMNKNVRAIEPNRAVVDAAREMRDGDFGVMPVCENDRVVGMLTDRDIAIRAVAEALDVKTTKVRDIMTGEVLTVRENQSLEEVSQLMGDRQVRRLPVVDSDQRIVGIISIGDLANSSQGADDAAIAISQISEPRHDEPQARH